MDRFRADLWVALCVVMTALSGGHLAYVSRAPNLYPPRANAVKRPQMTQIVRLPHLTNFIEFMLSLAPAQIYIFTLYPGPKFTQPTFTQNPQLHNTKFTWDPNLHEPLFS